MGWLFYHREKGESNLDHFRREFGEDGERLIDGATVGGTFYGAYRTKEGTVEAIVALIRWQRGEYNFGYKLMDERMGPNEARCPARILDLLTPLPECDGSCAREYASGFTAYCGTCNARDWREACRANIAKAASRPRIKQGDTIKVSHPWSFGDGVKEDTFTLANGRRKHWRRTDGKLVRLPQRSRWPEYEVVPV